jgi:hypothetical protein
MALLSGLPIPVHDQVIVFALLIQPTQVILGWRYAGNKFALRPGAVASSLMPKAYLLYRREAVADCTRRDRVRITKHDGNARCEGGQHCCLKRILTSTPEACYLSLNRHEQDTARALELD